MDWLANAIRAFLEAHWLSFILNLIAGIAMIVLSQGAWRTGMPKDENLKLSVGGLITILMSFFVPGSILPLVMGVAWMFIVYLRLENNNSPTLWCIAATLGGGLVALSFTVSSVVATPLSLVGGIYAIVLALEKIPTS